MERTVPQITYSAITNPCWTLIRSDWAPACIFRLPLVMSKTILVIKRRCPLHLFSCYGLLIRICIKWKASQKGRQVTIISRHVLSCIHTWRLWSTDSEDKSCHIRLHCPAFGIAVDTTFLCWVVVYRKNGQKKLFSLNVSRGWQKKFRFVVNDYWYWLQSLPHDSAFSLDSILPVHIYFYLTVFLTIALSWSF